MNELVLLIWLWQAHLSLVRSAADSISISHSSNFVESYSLKTAMSCSSELVRCVCFCMVHNVLGYWCITSLKGSVGVGVEVGCGWSMKERFCSSHSMLSKPSASWPSWAPTHWCKSCNSLVSAVNLAWLQGISSLRWPSAYDPPKAMVLSEPLVLSLSLSGPVFMPSVSSMWSSMSLSMGHLVPLWWVAIMCI